MEIVSVSNWEEFCSIAGSPKESTLFRGQRDPEWKLSSLWERILIEDDIPTLRPRNGRIEAIFVPNGYKDLRDARVRLFKKAMRERCPETSSWPEDDDEWAGMGRHFGLITPLLDWTYDPLIAAYFALFSWVKWVFGGSSQGIEDRRKQCPVVAVCQLSLAPDPFRKNEFELVTPKKTGPFTARIAKQKGVFTRLIDGVHFDLATYLDSQKLSSFLKCIHLPTSCASTAFKALHAKDIHCAALMPDAEGAAEYANWRFHTLPPTLNEIQNYI